MDFKNLFEALPDIIKLFVPGFVFLATCSFFSNRHKNNIEITIIGSVVLSYIFSLISDLLRTKIQYTELVGNIISVVLSFVSALIVVRVRLSPNYKKILKFIGRITGNDNIWDELFNSEKGAHIRCYTVYNHEKVTIEGDIGPYDPCADGECQIVLENYTVLYSNGNKYRFSKAVGDPLMYINTKDIHGLEVTYGK